jgi:tetratricopeptide (TPR) repeat protein
MNTASTEQTLQAARDYMRAAQFPEAESAFRQVLGIDPKNLEALNGLGTLALHMNRFEEAATLFKEAVTIRPSETGIAMNLGTALLKMNRLQDAGAVYEQVIRVKPDFAEAWANIAVVLAEVGRREDAEKANRRAIELKPNFALPYQNLGTVLRDMGRLAEAEQVLKHGLSIDPNRPEMLARLALVYLSEGLTDRAKNQEAIEVLRRALAIQPNHPYVLSNLGVALARLGRPEEAVPYHQQALQSHPNFPMGMMNLGVALRSLGRFDEAREAFGRALALEPNNPALHENLANELLVTGDWDKGLEEFERRLEEKSVFIRTWTKPRWDGSDPSGKTILLAAEQGIGETIQMARYAPLIAQRGGRVVMEVQEPIASLMSRASGVSESVAQGQTQPDYDAYAYVGSLPHLFHTTPQTIPATVPYLSADPARVEAWRQKLAEYGNELKVGLVWAGSQHHRSDVHRSMLLVDLAPLADVKGARFFSLQIGQPATQVLSAPKEMQLVDLGKSLTSFEETAAALANLDLVISVDTAIVHLAGAIARPVWTLLAFAPHWRWLLNRSDTPWYPTMRLFRQPMYGDWSGAVQQVKQELAQLVNR